MLDASQTCLKQSRGMLQAYSRHTSSLASLKHTLSLLRPTLSIIKAYYKHTWSLDLKHTWSLPKAYLMPTWCLLEACLKQIWSLIHTLSILEAWQKMNNSKTWSIIETCLNYTWSILEAYFKHNLDQHWTFWPPLTTFYWFEKKLYGRKTNGVRDTVPSWAASAAKNMW